MKKMIGLLAGGLTLFACAAAHAASVDVTPLATAGIGDVLVPVLLAPVGFVSSVLAVPVARYLGQHTAMLFQARVDELLHQAISYGAAQAIAAIERDDPHVDVDNWIVGWALDYANSHAPSLTKKAGALLAEKITARLASHPAVIATHAVHAARIAHTTPVAQAA